MGTNCSIIPLTETMVSEGANTNFKRPNPESRQPTDAIGCSLGGHLADPCGRRRAYLSGQERPFAPRGAVKPIGRKRMPVIQWVARYWIQPIGKS